jgi:phage terminase large subunit
MDYGLDMFACLWIALDEQKNAYIYKEIHEKDLVISGACEKLLDINNDENIYIKYAPPDLWNRRQETGKSAADIFYENGVTLTKSKNDRVIGWYNVKEWLKPYTSKDEYTGEEIATSKMKIFKNCNNLIKNLPQLQRDSKNPNDVATEPHDITHINDALRGFCCTYSSATKPAKEELTDVQKHKAKFGKSKKKRFI